MPKIVIFIFTGIVLLVGGAIAVMQQMEMGPFSSGETKTDEEKKMENLAQKKEIVLKVVNMKPLSIPVIQNNKVKLNLQLEIELKTTEELEPKLVQNLPILKDAYLRDLFAFIPRQLRKSKKLDKETLERRLRVVGQRIIGKGAINAVILKSYSEATKTSSEQDNETPENTSTPDPN
jgi:hypothetical protein